MKKLTLISLALLTPFIMYSQVCVNLYQDDDFGLEDRENRITSLEKDKHGNMWFALDGGSIGTFSKVGRFDGDTWATLNSSFLPDVRTRGIAFDHEDSVWIATLKGLGIVHVETMEGRTMTPDNSDLPEANVTAIAVDSNNVKWIGFSSGMVTSLDGTSFTIHDEWSNSPVKVIEIAADSTIWVGLGDTPGIVTYKNGTWTPYSSVKSIPAIETDKWGRVMIASADSMIIYNGIAVNVVHAATGNTLRDIAVRENGGIWASSTQGLLVRSGDRFIPYSNTNSALPSQLSDPIVFDIEDHLWFGYTYLVGSSGYSGTGYLYRPELQETAVISADKPSLKFCYGDSLTLTAAEDQPSYVWPDGTNTDTYKLFDSDTVEVAVEGDDNCFYYDTVRALAQKVYEDETVCAVSVDTNGRNIIIWEKTMAVGTESFNIYRELTTDSFLFISNVALNNLSVFEDPDVDPTVISVKYKISCVDTCGNESGQSFYHRTLHLQLSRGIADGDINLDWSAYEGLDFPYYQINRGSTPDAVDSLTTVPNDVLKYTDKGQFDTVYYRITIPILNECAPTENVKAGTGPYRHSLSNMDNNKKHLTAISVLNSITEIRAYPNPFSEITRIEFSNPDRTEHQLRVFNLSGKLVREIDGIRNSEVFLKRENLDPGYYIFELKGEKHYMGKFMVR